MVLAVTPSGQLTVRALPGVVAPEGTAVRDRTGRVHGRVARLFGPIDRPYLTVRLRRAPSPSDGVALVGSSLIREKG